METGIGLKEFTKSINRTLKGKYKVYWWGVEDGHISDWMGTAYRFTPIDGQPHRGFNTLEEARSFRDIDHEQPNLQINNGSSIPDARFVE